MRSSLSLQLNASLQPSVATLRRSSPFLDYALELLSLRTSPSHCLDSPPTFFHSLGLSLLPQEPFPTPQAESPRCSRKLCQLLPQHSPVAPGNPVTWRSVVLGWTAPLASCPTLLGAPVTLAQYSLPSSDSRSSAPHPPSSATRGAPPEPQGGSDLPFVSRA